MSQKRKQTRLFLFFGLALIIFFSFSYSLWIFLGPGKIPDSLTPIAVNQKIPNKENVPIMVSEYNDRCGTTGIFNTYERLSFQIIGNDLYLILKKKSSMVFEDFNGFIMDGTDLILQVNVSYVDCIIVAKMYLYIPDLDKISSIQINFIDPVELE